MMFTHQPTSRPCAVTSTIISGSLYSLLWNYALVHCKDQWTPAVFPHSFSELTFFMVCKTTFGHNRWKLFKGWMLFLRPHLTSQQGQQLLFETILSLLFGTSMVAAFLSSPAMPVLSTLCKLILLNQHFWLSGPVFSLYKVFQTMAHKPNLVCCPFLLYCLWLLSFYSGQSWVDLKGVNRASMPKICYLVLPKSARPSIQLSLQVTSCKHL